MDIDLKISTIPSMDRTVYDWGDLEPGLRYDYVVILINPMTKHSLESVEKMLADVDPVFYARKRVDFCYVQQSPMGGPIFPEVQHSIDTLAVTSGQSKEFCKKFNTYLHTIRVDDSDLDSVDYQARLCYNKAKRIIRNPILF